MNKTGTANDIGVLCPFQILPKILKISIELQYVLSSSFINKVIITYRNICVIYSQVARIINEHLAVLKVFSVGPVAQSV